MGAEEMDKQRGKENDVMRGIAIILVILGHAIIVYPINLYEMPWCNTLFTWLSSVHMPLFFLLAGFCYSFRQTPDKSWRVG
jgi:fucose 4-O-acetylase-like acetyltransferase